MSSSKGKSGESRALVFLYRTAPGRLLLKLLTARWISKLAGTFLDSPLSKPLIKRFVKKNDINLDDFHSDGFRCFNDCFTRKIKDGKRKIDTGADSFISPCDAFLSAYRIDGETAVEIKGSEYKIRDLVECDELAARYSGGACLVFRLCVHHYHRYIYLDGGTKGENVFIPGKLHTVRPIALETYPVFKRNCREYTVMHTDNFGDVTQIEVGAMLVGKIRNHRGACSFIRGEEKGMFLYGGSTIVLLTERGRVDFDDEIFAATDRDEEIPVLMGQRIGTKI